MTPCTSDALWCDLVCIFLAKSKVFIDCFDHNHSAAGGIEEAGSKLRTDTDQRQMEREPEEANTVDSFSEINDLSSYVSP